MSTENTEWELLEKRLNKTGQSQIKNKNAKTKKPRKRINIPICEYDIETFQKLVDRNKPFTWVFPLQDGLLITNEMVDVTFYTTDEETD